MAGALELVGYDLDSGKQSWSLDGFARIVNPTPAAVDGTLYVCTWSPGGDTDARIAMEPWSTALDLWDKNKNGKLENAELPAGEVRSRFFRIDLDSDQALDEAEWNKYARLFELAQNTMVALRPGDGGQPPHMAWEYKRGLPYVASPLIYRGRVFLAKDGGIVTLLDAATGKLIKQARARGGGNYYASPVGGDGKIYTASGAGSVTVFAATPELKILSAHDFGERIAAHARAGRRPRLRAHCAGPVLLRLARSPTARFGPARVALASCQCKTSPDHVQHWQDASATRFSTGKMPSATRKCLASCREPFRRADPLRGNATEACFPKSDARRLKPDAYPRQSVAGCTVRIYWRRERRHLFFRLEEHSWFASPSLGPPATRPSN